MRFAFEAWWVCCVLQSLAAFIECSSRRLLVVKSNIREEMSNAREDQLMKRLDSSAIETQQDSRQEERFNELVEASRKRGPWLRFFRHFVPRAIRRRLRKKSRLKLAMEAFARSHPDPFFLQIGSCDGVTGDPIHEHVRAGGWRGIVVEPVPYNFEKLVLNYADLPSVCCQNVIISSKDGTVCFWYMRETDDPMPNWYNQIGSLDRDHVLKHKSFIPNIEDYIVSKEFECLSLTTLLSRVPNVARIDLLHTDVEGHDYEILKQFDFDRYKPKLIVFEDFHLTIDDRQACQALLESKGYEVIREGQDGIAVMRG